MRKYLKLPNGVPTDDTYRTVMGCINTEHFFQATVQILLQTVNGIIASAEKGDGLHEKEIVSVDGKVKAFQTLNIYSSQYGFCLAQKFIDGKTNEIPAAQELLRLMDLEKTIVTADAMDCQKDTAAAIIAEKGDYVLALKGNQGFFYNEVLDFFDGALLEGLKRKAGCYKKTVGKEHGGVAVREYYISGETGWYSEKKKWEGLKSFGMVHKTLKKPDGTDEEEKRCYICSIGENADEFERAARGGSGVWKTTCTGRWILLSRMIRTKAWQKQGGRTCRQ